MHDEAVVRSCTIWDVRLVDQRPWEECQMFGIMVCVSHWGPSGHKCKSRMPMLDKCTGVCDEAVLAKAKLIRDRLSRALAGKKNDGITKCWVTKYTLQLARGEKVGQFTQGDVKRKLNRYLGLLDVNEAEACTFKAIRDGKATEVAAIGYTLGEITSAGDWLDPEDAWPYVQDDVADAMEILRQVIEMDPEDDEIEVTEGVNGNGG